MSDKYFGLLPFEELGDELIKRVDDYYNFSEASGRLFLWRESYKQYYNAYWTGGEVERKGELEELRRVCVNHYRNILQHLLVLTTDQPVQFEPQAINTDYKSMTQTILARGLLDYYMQLGKLDLYFNKAVEYALWSGEGWIYSGWDGSIGEPFAKVDNKTVMSGDLFFEALDPKDVIRDVHQSEVNKQNWFIIRLWKSKYELAKKYPQFEQQILSQTDSVFDDRYDLYYTGDRVDDYSSDNDIIPTYTFLHKKSVMLPEGRMSICLEDGTVVFDGDLPYSNFPLIPLFMNSQNQTPFGYSIAFDMLPLQRVIDSLHSTIVTNQNAFGVQNIIIQKGSGVEASDLGGGLRVLQYNPGVEAPKPLQLLATPPEIFKYLEEIIHELETISGVNSVARGNPPANLKSGNALALVQSMTLKFVSGLQRGYVEMISAIGTHIVNTLRDYAKSPRISMIVGKSQKYMMKEFVGDDLANISRVIVNMGSALSRSLAGRMEMADNLMQAQMVKTPEQYFGVIDTGRLEPLYEGERAELLLIRDENEKIANGEEVVVIATDSHILHIKEHKCILANNENRFNQQIIDNALTHIQDHIFKWQQTDPALLQALGSPPPPMPQPPPDVGITPGGTPQEPGMPSMPQNALTGQEWNPESGGLPQ